MQFIMYTDGACSGNPGPGGWGVVIEVGDDVKCLSGGEANTTNNRMELRAAIEGLNSLPEGAEVSLYTDSQYVKNGINDWIKKWRQNNWRNAAGKPVKNQDLWQQLDRAILRHKVSWHWVRGHAGNKGNEQADKLARMAIENR